MIKKNRVTPFSDRVQCGGKQKESKKSSPFEEKCLKLYECIDSFYPLYRKKSLSQREILLIQFQGDSSIKGGNSQKKIFFPGANFLSL